MAKLPDMKPRYYLATVDDDPRRCQLFDAAGNELPMVANAEWHSGGVGQPGRATVELMFVALGPPPAQALGEPETASGFVPDGLGGFYRDVE